MKAKLNLREEIYDCGDISGLVTIDTAIEMDAFLDAAGVPDEIEIDLSELLHANRIVGTFWDTDDVLDRRPDLTAEQAWKVLQHCDSQAAAYHQPITLGDIEEAVLHLYGDGSEAGEHTWEGSIRVTIRESRTLDREEVARRLADMATQLGKAYPDVGADPGSEVRLVETIRATL